MHATGRYEVFRLPDGVRRLLRHSCDESNCKTLEELRTLVADLEDGIDEVYIEDPEILLALQKSSPARHQQILRAKITLGDLELAVGNRV